MRHTQGFTLFMSFLCFTIYPSLLLAADHHFSAYATFLHTDALTALHKAHKGEMTRIANAPAPSHASWFWSLPSTSSFSDVILCVRADDAFHAAFNRVAVENRANPVTTMAKYMDSGVKGQ